MVRPLAVNSLVDALADALRERIFNGRLSAGAAVTETEVAREYDVARPTAKAAIERLVGVGLLGRDPHKSARVPVLGVNEIRDMYFARSCIEAEAMRRLAIHGPPPAGARDAITQLAAARESGPVTALVEPDIRFHRELVDALGSERLTKMHSALMGEMRLCMAQVQSHRLLRPADIVAEHEAILARVEDGDPDGAAAALVAHLERACTLLTAHLAGGEPLAASGKHYEAADSEAGRRRVR